VYIVYIYWSVVSVDVGIITRPTYVVKVSNTSRASLFLSVVGKAGKPTLLHPEDLRFEAKKTKNRRRKPPRRRRKRRKKQTNKQTKKKERKKQINKQTRRRTTITANPSEILPVSKYHVRNRESR